MTRTDIKDKNNLPNEMFCVSFINEQQACLTRWEAEKASAEYIYHRETDGKPEETAHWQSVYLGSR